jgi:hypothetical protein
MKLQWSPRRPKSVRNVSYSEWLETRRCFITIALEYATKKIQETKNPNLNGIHQFLSYADDVNIVGENIDTTHKNEKALLDAGKEVSLGVKPEKTKLRPPCKKAVKRHCIKKANRSF